MKKILTTLAIVAMLTGMGAGKALAAWVFEINPGVGSSIDINFVHGGEDLITNGYSLVFNFSGANFVSVTEMPPGGLGALPFNSTPTTLTLSTGAFAPVVLGQDFTVANFVFDAPAAVDWDFTSANMFVNVGGVTGVNLTGTQVNDAGRLAVVPLPGAVWLFGSGILGLVGLRRKFKA